MAFLFWFMVILLVSTFFVLTLLYVDWLDSRDSSWANYSYTEFIRRGGEFTGGYFWINNHKVNVPYFGFVRSSIENFLDTRQCKKEKSRKAREEIEQEVFHERDIL